MTMTELYADIAAKYGVDVNSLPDRLTSTLLQAIAENCGFGGGGGAQSDLNAAEGEPGHVLNRTHWSEWQEVTYIDNVTFAESTMVDVPLVSGQEYTITANGTTYVRSAWTFALGGLEVVCLGNGAGVGEEDTGEPFIFIYMDGYGSQIQSVNTTDPITVSLLTVNEVVHKLPAKYIPDMTPYYWMCNAVVDDEKLTINTSETPENIWSVLKTGREVIIKLLAADTTAYHYYRMGVCTIDLQSMSFEGLIFGKTSYILVAIENGAFKLTPVFD